MPKKYLQDKIYIIEANIDDMNPLVYETLFEKLYAKGALEVFLTPVYMKKTRPAAVLTVLCNVDKLEIMADLIFKETTSFGVRYYEVKRLKLLRRHKQVNTKFGRIRIAEGYLGNKLVNMSPEYEDCKKAAYAKNIPIREIIRDMEIKNNKLKTKDKKQKKEVVF